MKIITRYWVSLVLFICSTAIIIALIAEHIFNILPCQMCLYQRYPYYFIIILSLIFFIVNKFPIKLYYFLSAFSFILGLFFSLWHVGIEKEILPSLGGCGSSINITESLKEIREQIINQNIISCSEITWSFLGLSAATINSSLLTFLLILNLLIIFRENKKIIKH